jgi:hypothetical protein
VKNATFTRATQAPVNVRRRIMGRGVYYRINAGAYTGWWVGEYYPKVFPRGQYVSTVYTPQRTGTTKTVKFTKDSNAPFDRRSVANGRVMVQMTAGGLTGYWAPATQVLADGR